MLAFNLFKNIGFLWLPFRELSDDLFFLKRCLIFCHELLLNVSRYEFVA